MTDLIRRAQASPGHALDAAVRIPLERRIGHDFSRVRVHSGSSAAATADAIDARAFTVGSDVVFAAGEYRPDTRSGRDLLSHELAHVVQQGRNPQESASAFILSTPHDAQEQEADRVSRGVEPASAISENAAANVVHRQHRAPGPLSMRSPVFEETLTVLSDISAAQDGRALTATERALARPIFGKSIDFDRVRLIPTDVLLYRTVGDNIRVPIDFSISDGEMAQTLIHELTHVWQYQHGGTSYLSHSVQTQIGAAARGNRNFAYAYTISAGSTFFDFTPEQQGMIVENFFAMLRDQAALASAPGAFWRYSSNHQGADGFPIRIDAVQRATEIGQELPWHQGLIAQMQAALPAEEAQIMMLRASDGIAAPSSNLPPDSSQPGMLPIKPIIQINF